MKKKIGERGIASADKPPLFIPSKSPKLPRGGFGGREKQDPRGSNSAHGPVSTDDPLSASADEKAGSGMKVVDVLGTVHEASYQLPCPLILFLFLKLFRL